MLDRIATHADLVAAINDLAAQWRLVGPVARPEPRCQPPVRYFYEPVERAEQIDLSFNYGVYSPKRFLMPPGETLFTFRKTERGFTAEPRWDAPPTALIGVHPCDIHAIRTLDGVFSRDVRDDHYFARRERMFIVGVDCPQPCTEGVFCRDMESNDAASGFDVMLYPLDRHAARGAGPTDQARYGVVFGSDAGRAWLTGDGRTRTRAPSALDARDFENYQRRKQAAFPRSLRTPLEELPALLTRSYDSLLWQATAQRCYSCGSCNLVCPTCYCFDINEENDLPLTSGARVRTWDGCQLREFAVVAGDHNFRARPQERLRHRIFRKGMWIHQRTGLKGCVGCARCDRACTAHINSVEIYNQLAEEG